MRKLLLYVLTCASIHANAQLPVFKGYNINILGSTSPTQFDTAGGKLLFSGEHNNDGFELCTSDGTTAGTKMLMNICTGTFGSRAMLDGHININGKLIFASNSDDDGNELWISDGTAAGTKMLVNLATPLYSSSIITELNITQMGGVAYLRLTAQNAGTELWKTDGTPAGTQLVKDINPGTGSSWPSVPTACNGKIYFAADDGTNGTELWVSDGTAAGTQMVKDIYPGANNSSAPRKFIAMNNKVYFTANTSAYGWELWVSDGTTAGTQMIKDIYPGPNNSIGSEYFAVMNNKLYFCADDGIKGSELWECDGTTAGTKVLIDINPGIQPANPQLLTVHNNKLYFRAVDSANGSEPWISDGTTAGTKILKNIARGDSSSYITTFISHKKYVYFVNTPASGKDSIYQTDGTEAGTIAVAPDSTYEKPDLSRVVFYMYDSTLYFNAFYNKNGYELWSLKDTTSYPTPPPTGGIEPISANTTSLYPNPAHHNFTIKTTTAFKAGSVTLTDVTGRVVMTEKLYNNEQTISLQGIAPGIYMADVWLDDKRSTQKLIVQ